MNPAVRTFCRRAAVILLVPLVLAGCIRGLFEGETNVLRPEIIKIKGHTDSPAPPLKEVPPEPGAAGKPAEAPEKAPAAPPPVDQKLLPKELSPQAPEQLMPIPPPSPRPAESPQASVPQAPRLRAPEAASCVVLGTATLTEDTTWRGEVVIRGVVTVASQATLSILPGTVVRFDGSGGADGALLMVQGRISANGTAEQPILFASPFAEPRKGDWQGIVVLGSEKKNLLENCRIEGAETGLDASFSTVTLKNVLAARCGMGIRLQGTVVEASAGGASRCDVGMSLVDSEADLRDLLLSGNGVGIVAERSSLYLAGGIFTGNDANGVTASGCRVRIAAATFSRNGAGIALTGTQGSVAGCRIVENADYGVYLAGSQVRVSGNEIAKNGKAGLKVEDGRGVAWGNSFVDNGGYDLINDGREDFRAMGNWWGEIPPALVGKRVFDRQVEAGRGRVLVVPVAMKKPVVAP